MITIVAEWCTGCGACVKVCPTGALYLVDGKAIVDGALCRVCEACLVTCPNGAIILIEQEEPVTEAARLPALRPEAEVIQVRTAPLPVPLRSRALPVVGVALSWAGREILPRLADWLLYALDRRTTRPQARGAARSRGTLASATKGGGQQYRHRRRGGG